MKRSRHTEEQIIAMLKEAEAGRAIAELRREKGITEGICFTGARSTAAWRSARPSA